MGKKKATGKKAPPKKTAKKTAKKASAKKAPARNHSEFIQLHNRNLVSFLTQFPEGYKLSDALEIIGDMKQDLESLIEDFGAELVMSDFTFEFEDEFADGDDDDE